MLLDIAGELLRAGAAGMARTADNEQAVQAARQSLRAALPADNPLHGRLEQLAQQLDATYHAVKAEGRASARRDWATHRGLLVLAGLVLALGLVFWLGHRQTQNTVEISGQATAESLARIEAQLKEALAPKQFGEDPPQRKLPPELLEKAKLLLERGDKEQQALAKIALNQHEEADRLIQELKKDPLAEAFRLLTLEGTNWYNAGEFDKAIPPFEQALALQPNNTDARNWAAIAHGQARLGGIAAHQQRAIALLTGSLALLPERSWDWGRTQNNLGNAWANMPTGYRAENLTKAIAAFTAALEVFTRQSHPVEWAMTQKNLGVAWAQMPTGDKAGNLGEAIAANTAALEVYTRQAHPLEWAGTQNNLGNAWREMPTGDKAGNLGKAIAANTAALEVFTRQAHPVDWARTQIILGNAWQEIPTGDKAENLGKAIAAYTAALEVFTRQAYPVDWARTQNNLGNAWVQRTGDRAGSLGKAIAAYTAALEVRTRQADPAGWATTQNNLGNAWAQMPTGDKTENLGKAIAAYTAALEVRTRQAYPVDWAESQGSLGNAWAQMPTGDKAGNLGRAIDAYSAALEVYTRQAHPVEWAGIQNNLGAAWRDMPTGDRAENLGKAIAAYTSALEVFDRQADSANWAMIHFNRGLVFMDRAGLGGGCADWRKAIAEVKATAEVWTEAAFPFYHQNHIAPVLEQLRGIWQAEGCGGGFEAIPPAP